MSTQTAYHGTLQLRKLMVTDDKYNISGIVLQNLGAGRCNFPGWKIATEEIIGAQECVCCQIPLKCEIFSTKLLGKNSDKNFQQAKI